MENQSQNNNSKRKYILSTLFTIIPSTLVMGIITTYLLGLEGYKFLLNIGFYLVAGFLIGGFSIAKNTKNFIKPFMIVNSFAESLKNNDLTYSIAKENISGNNGTLLSLNDIMNKLRTLISDVQTLSSNICATSKENKELLDNAITTVNETTGVIMEIANSSTEQAHILENCNHLVMNLYSGLENILNDMKASKDFTEKAVGIVVQGEEAISMQESKMTDTKNASSKAVNSIMDLEQKSKEISDIVQVISSISEQTNLLALNASIEAARAGEYGRGFTIVADEIRKLAEQSASSAHEIGKIVQYVQSSVMDTVNEINKVNIAVDEQSSSLSIAVQSFKNVSEIVNNITFNINNVLNSTAVLTSDCRETEKEISSIAAAAEENAAATEEVSAAMSEQLEFIKAVEVSAKNLFRSAIVIEKTTEIYKV